MTQRREFSCIQQTLCFQGCARPLPSTASPPASPLPPQLRSCFEYTPAAPCNFLHADSAAKSLVEYPDGTGVTYRQGLIAALTTDGTTGEATLQVGWYDGWMPGDLFPC